MKLLVLVGQVLTAITLIAIAWVLVMIIVIA